VIEQIKNEQPDLFYYLLSLENELSRTNYEDVLLITMVVWLVMRESPRRLKRVRAEKLIQLEDEIMSRPEHLAKTGAKEKLYPHADRWALETPEPEVLRYIVEAVVQRDEEGRFPPHDPNRNLMFIYLKIIFDALCASLGRDRAAARP
jgi:hypothetical protein